MRNNHKISKSLSELVRSVSKDGEISGPSVARILKVSTNWITERASNLEAISRPNGKKIRGADGRFLYKLDQILKFISKFEKRVNKKEKTDKAISLISTEYKKQNLFTLTDLKNGNKAPKNFSTIKTIIEENNFVPCAFCISSSGLGYSLLYKEEVKKLICRD